MLLLLPPLLSLRRPPTACWGMRCAERECASRSLAISYRCSRRGRDPMVGSIMGRHVLVGRVVEEEEVSVAIERASEGERKEGRKAGRKEGRTEGRAEGRKKERKKERMHLGGEGGGGHVHVGKVHEHCHTRRACAMCTCQAVDQHTPSL